MTDIRIDPRPSWDEYYMAIVDIVSTRADCSRAQHGCVIVDAQHRLVSAGYNGATPGHPGCLTANACPRGQLSEEELGHLDGGYDDPAHPGYCMSVHAEANAILDAGRTKTIGSTIYHSGKSCHGCLKLIRAAGLARAVYRDYDGKIVSYDVE